VPKLDDTPAIGKTSPRADGVDIPYWDGLREGELRVQRCDGCSTWWWGPVWRCAHCGSWDLTWTPVEATGRVYSWIRTHQAFVPDLAPAIPFVTLLVELPHVGNRRMMGILVDSEAGLKIGAPVVGVIQQPSGLTNSMPVMRWRLAGS
jgi:uncharacterized OB-fold protein